jgi:hypothetical protein
MKRLIKGLCKQPGRKAMQGVLTLAAICCAQQALAASGADADVLGEYVEKLVGKDGSMRVWVRGMAIAAFVVGCLDSVRTFHPRSAIMGLFTALFIVVGYGVMTGDYLSSLFNTFNM